jgi:prevent-host-death family protein
MGDHIGRTGRRTGSRTSVGVRELKTHAARILRHVREDRTSYLLTHRGRTIGVILPVDSEEEAWRASEPVDATAAWAAFLRAGRGLEQRFGSGARGVRRLSDMRR